MAAAQCPSLARAQRYPPVEIATRNRPGEAPIQISAAADSDGDDDHGGYPIASTHRVTGDGNWIFRLKAGYFCPRRADKGKVGQVRRKLSRVVQNNRPLTKSGPLPVLRQAMPNRSVFLPVLYIQSLNACHWNMAQSLLVPDCRVSRLHWSAPYRGNP